MLNAAIDESTWREKQEALASAMGMDRSYLSRIRSKEKPLNAQHLLSLPAELGAIFSRKYAEAFGQIVVYPSRGEDAVRDLVRGLIGVLTAARLPDKSAGQARAGVRRTE